jgi:hypothetical protein
LPDLIRSKETERNSDWQDIALLEEVLDARLLARVEAGRLGRPSALAQVRSRTGFENYLQRGYLSDPAPVRQALHESTLSVTHAFLLPGVPDVENLPPVTVPIEPILVRRLRTVSPGSTLHLTIVEAVRRQYKLAMQAADRADKEATRAARPGSQPSQS